VDAWNLSLLGWDDSWAEAFAPYAGAGVTPARIARVDRGACRLLSAAGELRASCAAVAAGAADPRELPSVGDWAAVRTPPDGRLEVAAILERRTALVRGAVGRESRGGLSGDSHGQVLAANVDIAFVVEPTAGIEPTADDAGSAGAGAGSANLGRIERLIALAWQSGAVPVVLVTKADLVAAPDELLAEVATVAPGADAYAVSARTGEGMAAVRARLAGSGAGSGAASGATPARTAVLLGASGAGKSTLVNALAGDELMRTQQIRAADGRGRHTTTHRELIPLPGGGLLIDTPGLRRIGLVDAEDGLDRAFADIEALAAGCRFDDCSHGPEPGCAVLAAVEAGELPRRRLSSWYKLRREAEWMASRTDARLRAERTRRWKRVHREVRRAPRHRR
jgi:ribosome biogenesis GTPase